ncbi:MAG: glycosyltransferase family 39 protein [Myxococcota bacterium]|nr:glycosyltransferase family 39 protein [Myxococcota bacterium]
MLALRRRAAVLALVPLAYLILFHGLGRYGVVNGDEGFYHAVAATMVETGDFLRLEFHGEHRLYDTFMNAPLQYWGRALAISLLGDGRVAMRIQSALFGLASVMLSYAFARRLASRRAAFLVSAIQLTTFQFVYWHSARTGELETATAFFFTAVAWCFVRYVETGRGLVLHHVCWLLLANWKLPLALLPLVAETAAFALLPAARARIGPWLRSAALLLPLGFVWHAGQLVAHWDDFLSVADRMLTQAFEPEAGASRHGVAANARFYFFSVLYGAFPYSLLYPFAFGSLLWAREEHGRVRLVVLGLFIASVFAFFVVVEKHHRWYWTPALPLLSIFVGVWLDRIATRRLVPSVLGAFALLAAGLALIDVDLLQTNPFQSRTPLLPLATPLRSWFGGPPGVAVLWIGLLAVALCLAGRFLRPRAAPALAALIFVVAFGVGTLRVMLPLRHLDQRTEMARLRETIDTARAEGRELSLPIAIREGGELKVRSLFARDFEIVPGSSGVSWWLFAPGDPRAAKSIRRGFPDD